MRGYVRYARTVVNQLIKVVIYNMIKIIHFIIAALFLCSLIGCNEVNKTKNKNVLIEVESSDAYLNTIEELEKDFFNNYWKIEDIVLEKLKKEGSEFFIKNECYDILGKFESTLEAYCQICEKLKVGNHPDLLTSYLHLNDTKNVKKQYELMQNDPNAFIYREFHNYKDSEKVLEGKYVSIKYDERVEEFANAVFAHVNTIEESMTQEWNGLLPPKVRVILLYSDGPGPYNINLNESYLPVKSKPISSSIDVAGHIFHETFHLVNSNLFDQNSNFDIGMEVNSFKFLDEGYAQLIESKFKNTYKLNKANVNQYSKELMLANTFDFKNLKSKWHELFSSQDVSIYTLAYSFSYFLEEKFGEEKLKALFLPRTKVSEDSWVEYVENYFDATIDDLIEEWKQQLKQ